jgi:carbamoyl-phosphate synthase large subunit
MTGAGAPGAPGIIHCLKQYPFLQLTVGDADANATGRYLHHDFVVIPKADDEAFIADLLSVCRQKKINVVLPLVTRELFLLSQNKTLFEQNGIQVLVSSYNAIQIANNKSACYGYLKEKGISVPDYRVANTIEEFINGVKDLGYPGKPVCFKPSVSNGSRGFRIIAEKDEADLLFNYKPYNTFITYNDAVRILSGKPFPQLLISDYLPGHEYSVDCLADAGKAMLIVPRLRTKMINGISVQGEIQKDDEIMVYCTRIIEAIGLHGNIGIQVKRSAAGQPLLVEINPRVQGTIVACLGAGVNLPLLAVKQQMGIEINKKEMEVRWGTRFSRYWTEVYY